MMTFPKSTDMLEALRAYAGSPDATAPGVAAMCDRLDADEWDQVLERTSDLVPLPDDGRKALMLGDGGEGWSILWWDRRGRRAIGRFDVMTGKWYATVDDEPAE